MQDWVILWEVRNSRSHFNDDNNNGEGNCIPAAQACRELVEFSEELTIQWTWNASLALAGASLWCSANCRWPVFDVTPNTVTDGDKTPVIRRHIIVFSWTVTSSAFIKTFFCSLLKFFLSVFQVLTHESFGHLARCGGLLASVALFGRIRSSGGDGRLHCYIAGLCCQQTGHSQCQRENKLGPRTNYMQRKKLQKLSTSGLLPRLNNTLNSSMCLLICSFPPLNRLNKVSVNNMLWCHILNNSFHSLPRGLSPFDGWPDRVSLFPESAHRQRLQNTTEWFYTLHLHLGHN